MLKSIFWGNKKSPGKATERLISSKRIKVRRVSISKWAREAQNCDLAISKIDIQLSALSGEFTRARKEYLLARRCEWQGKLKIAQSHLENQKSKLSSGLQHNLNVTTKRF